MRPPPAYREYLLASAFGWTLQEIDEQPAVRTDWLVACHLTVEKTKADMQREAGRG